MKKKILFSLGAVIAVVAGVAAFSAFEAHIINVTAHIENALGVDTYGIDFGTVFPQEFLKRNFEISLSNSFIEESEADTVSYKIVQKPKHWRDDFDGTPPEHRSLVWIDPDNGDSGYTEGAGVLTIHTGNDVEDLYGPGEPQTGTDWTAPRKMMRIGGNFTIETKVTADPEQSPTHGPYQGAGILVYEEDGDVVRLELTAFSGMSQNAVYMESQEDAVKVGKGWSGIGSQDYVWLRLSREGDTFKGKYSLDGTTWQDVAIQSPSDFENEKIGGYPLVGVAVVDNDADNSSDTGFEASFDYVDINGNYQDFCRFLSKMKDEEETGETTDVNEPSYYQSQGAEALCQDPKITAHGTLTTVGDPEDKWWVDLMVPPIAGYVGQDWPESCRQDWVVPEEADYGCDLWIEVTGILPLP